MAKIHTLVNQKGGVGKTTSAINVGAYLGYFGQRVLIVDLDPQANATSSLGIDKMTVKNSTYEVVIGSSPIAPTILHNPRCTKSRATLNMLLAKGIEPKIIDYLENPPTTGEFKEILAKLGLGPRDVIRKGEKVYKQMELSDTALSDTALVTAMVGHPILIERPIVINGD